ECTSNATFVVLASGNTLSYQWYFANASLPNKTNATLVLPNVHAAANGNYHVVISNPAGNVTSRDALLTVGDTIAPVITLVGPAFVAVECHGEFTDSGATAADGCAGNLTPQIITTGSVNVNVTGTYVLHYNVSDPGGNPAVEKTRTVQVVDTTR